MDVVSITPFLWFERGARDAARAYVAAFGGTLLTDEESRATRFAICDREFIAFDGGVLEGFTFSPAVSFMVHCATQAEIDRLWAILGEGGAPGRCGWLTDRFGVTWQVVPERLSAFLTLEDEAAAERVVQAMLGMSKLDLAALEAAAAGP